MRCGGGGGGWWLWGGQRVPAGSALATMVVDKACDLAAVAVVLAVLEVVPLTGAISTPRGLLGAAALAAALLSAVLGTAVLGPRLARSARARPFPPPRSPPAIPPQPFPFTSHPHG